MTAIAAAPVTDIKLQIHRTYNATPQALFEAWTKPELIKEWFGCGDLLTSETTTDPRVGGAYRLAMEGPSHDDPNVYRCSSATGVYTVFDPYTKLSFTWNSSWEPAEETLVTVELKPIGGGTELLLTHERFLTEESRDAHNKGWTECLDKIGRLFA